MIVETAKSCTNRPRISKTFIFCQLGDPMLRTNLNRLPNLNARLNQWVESPFVYRCLRIDWAIERLITQGLPLKLWRIRRLANIRDFSEALQTYAIAQVIRYS
ncbi:hypothetical protein AT959_18810 [Dechloromonas denitrificans]|uniref:Transposase DDE domain-containing protein n=2 Tax=Dechloromonas denitrificans TaxID=281362 RepID=A0A133XE71_9RHOO|nr:hypothetical protein AT959_18810 [Dechloromonas denitrificans]